MYKIIFALNKKVIGLF